MRQKKHLKTAEKRLFRHVMRHVKPLNKQNLTKELESFEDLYFTSKKEKMPPLKFTKKTVESSQKPQIKQPLIIDPSLGRSGLTSGIDRRTAQRLRQGKVPIDGKLDLHGYHLHNAHNRMVDFIQNAYANHNRCLLIITGKGRLSPHGRGKIKNALPLWLNEPNLRPLILSVCPASRSDGGTGAFYIYLRRNR